MLSNAKRGFLISCIAILLHANGSLADKGGTQPRVAPIFEVQDLFSSVRIPNIVVATDGTVLAFAKSGRILRRSENGGRSWGLIQEVGPLSLIHI